MSADDRPIAPFPLDGNGYAQRFSGPDRIKPGGVQRAKRLRATPTHPEAKLWQRLRHLDIRVRRQAPIGPYVVDFVCLRAKLVIEVDGGVHGRTDVAVRDLERDAWLTTQGFRVFRTSNKRIETELDAVVAEVERAIRSALPKALATPFPSRGKGWGWGGGRLHPDMAPEASSKDNTSPSAPSNHQPATTPPNPPPRGEGFSDF